MAALALAVGFVLGVLVAWLTGSGPADPADGTAGPAPVGIVRS
ncbi:hypothetical protein ACFPK1_12630 [Actinomycetospora rhizophila]|uniref:Uncharacterized protein n=1 Tax=Actinomycetospora rhizophila TaxID=1416876 RepID=A0ABV9ZFJ7_9PSEU